MNKKGGEKLISLWWFFVLIVVSVGIVIAVLTFVGKEQDARLIEAEVLSNRAVDCISDNGKLKDIFSIDFDFAECGFKKEAFDTDFYIRIKGDVDGEEKKIALGNNQFEQDCFIGEKSENYPKCVLKKLNFEHDGSVVLEILAGSNQKAKKAAV